MSIIQIGSEQQFDDIIINTKDKKYILFQFSNKTCPPCRRLNSALDRLSHIYTNILFCNVETFVDNYKIKNRFKIRNLPTILFFESGKIDLLFSPLISPSESELENKLKLLNDKNMSNDNF